MTLNDEAQRNLILAALRGLSVSWTLDTARSAFEKQNLILRTAQAVKDAPLDSAKVPDEGAIARIQELSKD